MRKQTIAVLTGVLWATLGCFTTERTTHPKSTPLFEGMGSYRRVVTTENTRAKSYFDQGLIWTYAFNHDEAIRSFQQATLLDPQFVMAWWGIALANGPNINNPVMPPERSEAAWFALQQAVTLKERASPVERALVEALEKRYRAVPPQDRTPLDKTYAVAMRKVWKKFPNDPDVGVLYAESMMDLRPWDLWNRSGKMQPGTQEIRTVLEKVLTLEPNHPGALHLQIHALEASPHPERAVPAANRLRHLVPASGHLVHMPSHIDVLTGEWVKASIANVQAIEADRAYRKISPKQGFYHIYMAHNHHMLCFASMMEGRSQIALRAAREMVAGVPEDYKKSQSALVDGFMAAPYEVLMRFGKWDEILKESQPPGYFPITTALWRFTRAVAYAAKGEIEKAKKEREVFQKAAAAVPKGAMMSINPAAKILDIARHVLDGEIAFRQRDIDTAIASLRQGIQLEDNLLYMEPPEWIQPVRQTLGAILVAQEKFAEAERVYREDLKKWPENGWSLFGLAQSLRGRGKWEEAEKIESRFQKAWSRADIQIGSSCLCVAVGQ